MDLADQSQVRPVERDLRGSARVERRPGVGLQLPALDPEIVEDRFEHARGVEYVERPPGRGPIGRGRTGQREPELRLLAERVGQPERRPDLEQRDLRDAARLVAGDRVEQARREAGPQEPFFGAQGVRDRDRVVVTEHRQVLGRHERGRTDLAEAGSDERVLHAIEEREIVGRAAGVRRARELRPHAVVPLDPDDLLDQVDLEVEVGAVARGPRPRSRRRRLGASCRACRTPRRRPSARRDSRATRPHAPAASTPNVGSASAPASVTPRATDPPAQACHELRAPRSRPFEPLRVGAALEPVRRLRMQIETARGAAGPRPA